MSTGAGERGMILVGVLVVVVVLALLAGTALVAADAEVSAVQGTLRREQSRAIAWSGVQAAMAELGRQRDAITAGQVPQVTGSWMLFGDPAGTQGVVRLLEPEPGLVLVPEAAKLDLNTVNADALAASGAIDREAAGQIVAARDKSPFGSVAEALATIESEGPLTETIDVGRPHRSQARTPVDEDPRLTVFSFEPNTQIGLGGGAAGDPRLFVGDGWRDELKSELRDRLSARAAAAVEKILRARAPKSLGDIVAGLRREQVAVREWAAVLDALTVSPDAYLTGRVDVLTASREVLRAVPGMNDQMAEQIERVRDRIDADARLSVVWLVQQGVMTGAQFQGVVDQVTCRCLQWRVRVEGGYGRSTAGPDGRLPAVSDRVVLEAVIDLSGSRPRLAYLRDVTYLEEAKLIAQLREAQGEGIVAESASELERAADLELESEMEEVELEIDGSLGAEGGGGLDLSPMDMSGDLNLGGPGRAGGAEPAEKEVPSGVDRRVGRWKIPTRPDTERR